MSGVIPSDTGAQADSVARGLDCRIAFEGYRAVLINSTAWQQAWQTEICGGCVFVPHPAHILCDG